MAVEKSFSEISASTVEVPPNAKSANAASADECSFFFIVYVLLNKYADPKKTRILEYCSVSLLRSESFAVIYVDACTLNSSTTLHVAPVLDGPPLCPRYGYKSKDHMEAIQIEFIKE